MDNEKEVYRIIEVNDPKDHNKTTFVVQKRYLINVGWLLFPTWEEVWDNLTYSGDESKWYRGNKTEYYESLDKAKKAISVFEKPILKIHI